ncbi:hypothetical protein GUJ93_ZPchr0001g30496 [Zizania palustris]|uniref:Uncharacterized protein n=1 Tax=Zizania palustris TaxID=103762 RepID=A0A8J5RN52_ZIZPA|nr:hypothetical protein GUJ93_ZPchr0001g30496 [Zizania palustris]
MKVHSDSGLPTALANLCLRLFCFVYQIITLSALSSSSSVASFLLVTLVGGGSVKVGAATKRSDIDYIFDAFAFDFALLNGFGVGRGVLATTTAGSSFAHHQNLGATYKQYVGTADDGGARATAARPPTWAAPWEKGEEEGSPWEEERARGGGPAVNREGTGGAPAWDMEGERAGWEDWERED